MPFQLFDALDPATEAALRASIKRWGVIVPVVVDQHGQVIDGHHRKRIADELGVPCPEQIREVENDEEARQLAVTLNTDRRHLAPEHRRPIVADLRAQGHSLRAIAGALGISKSQVANDLEALSTSGQSPQPERVRTSDGRTYPATRPAPKPEPEPEPDDEPLFAPGEHAAILDTLHEEHGDDLTPDDIERAVEENIESKRVPDPQPEPKRVPDRQPEREPAKTEWKPTKPDLGGGISHPARYSQALLDEFRSILKHYDIPEGAILDPFAGTGRIHELQNDGWDTVGVEIEKEYADMHPDTVLGSALDLPFDPETFAAIVTSPTYGNRLADSHNASDPERRRSYTHDLGRKLHAENSGTLHWRTPTGRGAAGSEAYRTFHEKAWREAVLVLRPGGLFVLNCCDHIRDGLTQPVTAWHCWMLGRLGLDYVESRSVATQKLRQGDNASLRHQEQIHVFRKPR